MGGRVEPRGKDPCRRDSNDSGTRSCTRRARAPVRPPCTAEWLGYVFDKRCGSREASALLDRVVQERFPEAGLAPGTRLRVDNGPAYRADAFRAHARAPGLEVEHIQVRTPEDNGVIESFHAGLDRDYLNALVFDTFAEAEAFLAWAFEDCNAVKPMRRLRWRTPREYHEEVVKIAK